MLWPIFVHPNPPAPDRYVTKNGDLVALPWLCPDNSILKREYAELFFAIGEAEVPVCITSTMTSLCVLETSNALL